MSAAGGKDPSDVAFEAALAARRETFLARWPRLLKLVLLGVLLAALGSPLWLVKREEGAQTSPAADLAASQTEEPSAGRLPSDSPVQREGHHAPLVQKKPPEETSSPSPLVAEQQTDIQRGAVARNDAEPSSAALTPAPDINLVEETLDGYLPKIGADGRKPWQVYARPFDRLDPRPRIVLVVGDLGLSRVATDAALRRLPAPVTLAFDVQAGDSIAPWLIRARQDGHETLLALPMEPLDYPRSDPGPNALLTTLPNSDNLQRLLGFLKKGVGYVGVTTLSGSRFVADKDKLVPILDMLRQRGLLILDARIAPHSVVRALALETKVPVSVVSRMIDSDPTPQAIEAALAELERMARAEGSVVAMASPLPVTLERIEAWAKGLAGRGLVLAPVSAVVE